MTYDDGLAQLLQGDALDVMAEMPERSVDVCITSPPYWGLRLYSGEQERVWNGAEGCEHEWTEEWKRHKGGATAFRSSQEGRLQITEQDLVADVPSGQFCQRCGAWRGAFGNEPSVALYISHLMEFMRAIKRVLKDAGVAWINLGDSYIGGGTHHGNKNPGLSKSSERQSFEGTISSPGIEPLNLAGVPQRFFLACQEQGWIVRSEIILAKDSPMPESLRGWFWARHKVKVGYIPGTSTAFRSGNYRDQDDLPDNSANKNEHKDLVKWADCPGCERCIPNGGLVLRKGSWRPTSSHEKLFMLTKGDGYFSDGEEVRLPYAATTFTRMENPSPTIRQVKKNGTVEYSRGELNPGGANLRDVWPMKSSAFTMQLCKSCKRVYTGAQFGRLRGETKRCSCGASDWLSHFAAFHPSLPTTCILASTSPKGNCSKCGMPWVRVIEKQSSAFNVRVRDAKAKKASAEEGYKASEDEIANYQGGYRSEDGWTKTLDWKASCNCNAPSEAAVVLDPFNGTASTGVAAKRLGRRYIGIDTSEDYLRLSAARLAAETPGMI